MTSAPLLRDALAGLSPLGFGVSGPHATSLVARAQTCALVREAYDLGVTVFDTAPFYGRGEAERRLGVALGELMQRGVGRDDLFVSTKVGKRVASLGFGGLVRAFSPQDIETSLEHSLARLGLAYVDAVFLHGPKCDDLTPALARAVMGLRDSGKTRLIGLCGRGRELDAAWDLGCFDMVMTPVRRTLPEQARERIARWRAAGKPVIGIETLGRNGQAMRVPRRLSDLWSLARGLRRGGGLKGVGRRENVKPDGSDEGSLAAPLTPEACLRWALREGGADIVMSMTTRLAHLKANVASANLAADGDDGA